MALNDVTANKGQGGLGRPLEGTDYVSGLLFYSDATLPSGFTSSDRIKTIFSVSDAVNLGITNARLGEIQAVHTGTVGTKFGSNGKLTITATVIQNSPLPVTGAVTLCDITTTSADADTDASAARIAAAINAGTSKHGFAATASGTGGVFTVTVPSGQGVFMNLGASFAVTQTSVAVTFATNATTAGVASDIDILYYHISEFFRIQPKGKLYVGVFATADVGTFAALTTMQNFASGDIKQIGVYQKTTAFAGSQCNSIQGVLTTLEGVHKPMQAILAGEISGTTSMASLSIDLHQLSDPNVSVTIGQDGANAGARLFKATGKSITNLGEALGAVALSKVNESIAWFGKFQVASAELDTLAFANGELYTSLSDGTIVNLDTLGYMFLRKVIDLNGSYHNRPYTAVALTSDYAFIHPNRTIYKAIKGMRSTVLPAVASPVKVDASGKLSLDAIGYFEGLANQGLSNMLGVDSELSAAQVTVNPDQDVVSTGQLVITAKLLPYGTADFIIINVGFTASISQ